MTEPVRTPVPIRVGVIGTGFAAECHAEALQRLPWVRLVGIASRTRSRAVKAADRLGAERAFADPFELIADSRVDAVHVCTINRFHAELSSAALSAGKHVVTEKPLATDRESAEVLAMAAGRARTSGTLAAVCFNYRHYSLIQQLRAILASGEYGRVHFVHGSYLQDWLLYETGWNWRLDPADNGTSRAIADIGSHWIDLVQHVTGSRSSRSARTWPRTCGVFATFTDGYRMTQLVEAIIESHQTSSWIGVPTTSEVRA